jgi:hypothetical protein
MALLALPALAQKWKNMELAERYTPLKDGMLSRCINVVSVDGAARESPMFRYGFDTKTDGSISVDKNKIAVFKNSNDGIQPYAFSKPGVYKLTIDRKTAKSVWLALGYNFDTK